MIETTPKAALITGAARRIGRAMALDLGRQGWSVAVHYRASKDEAAEVVAAIEEAGGRAVALEADLAKETDTQPLVARAVAALGPLGLLINNASLFEPDTVADSTRESWDAHIEANLRAPVVLIQNFARLLAVGTAGNVVNILDQRVWNPTPFFLSYTVSKTGLWTLTQTLALALAPRIRVNAIGPGPTLPSARQSAENFARQCAQTPLRRGTTPDEICAALRFILAAPAMTGQMIGLDGGQHLGWAHPQSASFPE